MGDDHVDRRDVEALQGVKLTRTNRSCGLTIKFLRCVDLQNLDFPRASGPDSFENVYPSFLGGFSEGVPPVPIPNTAVKPFSPDGTAR